MRVLGRTFRFRDPNGLLWSVPPGREVDGASIPRPFWSFIGGPFAGRYMNASVIHDHYCDVKTRTEHDTHRNFYYGMRVAGVATWKAKFMYWVVELFGPEWVLTGRMEAVSSPPIDFSHLSTHAVALSKASTVARSLKTTDGRVLDISVTNQIVANLENISRSANQYRAIFANRSFINTPEQLGVLSQWNAADLDEVETWEGERLPSFSMATVLVPSSLASIRSGRSFKLDPDSAVSMNTSELLHSLVRSGVLERNSILTIE